MASSGNITSNSAGARYPNPNNLYFEWWVSATNQAENWTEVTFNLKAGGGRDGYWVYYNNILASVDGQDWRAGRIKAYNGQVLLTGTKRMWHDAQGNRGFGIHVEAGIYGHGVNARGDGSWWLDPLAAQPAQPAQILQIRDAPDFTDEENPTITFDNNGGYSVKCKLEIEEDIAHPIERWPGDNATSCTFDLSEQERAFIYSKAADKTQLKACFVVCSMKWEGSGWQEKGWTHTFRTCNIVDAAPSSFSYSYQDANRTVASIVGNKGVLVKGLSSLEVSITDPSYGHKGAYIAHYIAEFSGRTSVSSDSDNIVLGGSDFGSDFDTGQRRLKVTAVDSRGDSTSDYTDITVLDYNKPTARAETSRLGNVDNELSVFVSGEYSPLEVDGTAKNAIKSVQYRYKSDGDWSDWQICDDIEVDNGHYKTKRKVLNLSSDKTWHFEARVEDKLSNAVMTNDATIGKPIFRIGVDGYVYNNEQPLMPSHIGQVIMSTTLKTASQVEAIYRGKWEAWGQGRMPVGVDPDDYDFSAPNKRGGKKRVTLTLDQIPSHSHPIHESNGVSGDTWRVAMFLSAGTNHAASTEPVGGGESHENMPPYQSIYMWVRVE